MIAVVESIPTPPVAWSALIPLLAFTGAALLLLLVSALTPRRLPRGRCARSLATASRPSCRRAAQASLTSS